MSLPTLTPVTKLDSFGSHFVDPALDRFLGQLHVGDAVLQQSTDAIGPFVDRHVSARLC